MSNLLTTYQLTGKWICMVSCKLLKSLNKFDLLFLLTPCHGKLILACKSLILLVLTNLPNFPPIRGYRGAVSNPPHAPYVTIAKESKNYA